MSLDLQAQQPSAWRKHFIIEVVVVALSLSLFYLFTTVLLCSSSRFLSGKETYQIKCARVRSQEEEEAEADRIGPKRTFVIRGCCGREMKEALL